QLAREVGADVDDVLAGRPQPVHRVEGRDRFDLGGRDADQLADLPECVLGHHPVDRLGQIEQRHDRGARTGWRVPVDDPPCVVQGGAGEHRAAPSRRHQRSTPPITGSIEAIAGMMSAISAPSIRSGTACRLTNDGSRMCTRYGRWLPSDTTYIPSSPRGASTVTYTSPGGTSTPCVTILK